MHAHTHVHTYMDMHTHEKLVMFDLCTAAFQVSVWCWSLVWFLMILNWGPCYVLFPAPVCVTLFLSLPPPFFLKMQWFLGCLACFRYRLLFSTCGSFVGHVDGSPVQLACVDTLGSLHSCPHLSLWFFFFFFDLNLSTLKLFQDNNTMWVLISQTCIRNGRRETQFSYLPR